MSNLLQETILEIKHLNLDIKDIIHIGNNEYKCTWDEFSILANFEYDDGYGLAEVAMDLTIVFNDGSRLVRWEYDGSEGWEIIRPFIVEHKQYKQMTSLVGGYEPTIDSINGESE